MANPILAQDYLLVMRGAERTFATIADIWPRAPIATLLYDEKATHSRFAGRRLRTSALQRLGMRQRTFRAALPLYQNAVKHLDLSGYDCVVSSSSAFAHGIRPPRGAAHVCYCHAPFRYAWHEQALALSEVPGALRPALSLLLRRHRSFDRRAATRVDQYIANGKLTRERIRRYWGRDAPIVHPPVDVERFSISDHDDHVLFVGSSSGTSAQSWLSRPLARPAVDQGGRLGPELGYLQARYGREAEFLGRVDDDQLPGLYASAAALVVPGVEEFGISAVEAQAAGRPVIAIDAGGVRETVRSGETGLLVENGDARALTRALSQDLSQFDSQEIRNNAQRFRPAVFRERIREIVEATCP